MGRIFEHGGAMVYHRAQLYIAPDAGLAAVMLSDAPQGTKSSWKLNEELMLNYAKLNKIKSKNLYINRHCFSILKNIN